MTGHVANMINCEEYIDIFETIWKNRASESGWTGEMRTVCSIIGFILSLYGLAGGLLSIGADGWAGLGVIFIMPSVIALIIIVLDFLISIDKIKKD